MSKSFLRSGLAGFQPYIPGEQPPDGEGWVKLNTNESPLPPSPRVIEAIKAATDDSLRLYPSPTAAPARQAIAKHFGLAPMQVTLGNGADELIEMCLRAFAGAGDRVAYPTPTYPLLEPLCRLHDAVPSPNPSGELFTWSPELMDDPAPLKFLVNPNSPTGTWHGGPSVERVVKRSKGVVVLDEAYVDFAFESQVHLLAKHANLLIIRTMSKSYALAGMRIGYALGSPELIADLDAVKDSYNLDRLAIVAATAAIEDALRERRILVRHYDRDPIAGWLRITVGTRDQHERLLEALREILI